MYYTGIKNIQAYYIWMFQCYYKYENVYKYIKLSKILTKTNRYYIYFLIILYYNYLLFVKTLILFYSSRIINTFIKNKIKQKRPYNEFSQIKYYHKHKISYSLPSQSIQSILIVYNSFKIIFNTIFIDIYFCFIVGLLCITRIFRGLHYPHDFIISWMITNTIIFFGNIIYNKFN